MKHELIEINSQLDHLESLYQSLEPVDENETNQCINRTKLHRFIRIHDDLDILNERLIHINDHSSALLSNEQIRITNDLKLLFDRLNSIKRIVRIHLEQLEKLLAKNELNQSFSLSRNSPLRSSNPNLQVKLRLGHLPVICSLCFSVFINRWFNGATPSIILLFFLHVHAFSFFFLLCKEIYCRFVKRLYTKWINLIQAIYRFY